MSITDELREWVREAENDGVIFVDPDSPHSDIPELLGIADRIDEQHKHAVMSAMNDALYHANDESMAELGWLRLPKDADGVSIYVGDRLDGYGKTIEVVELRYGRSGWVIVSRDGNAYADTFAFTHHHEPTVEDVLREFAEKITDSQIPNVHPTYEEAIAEYTAKLRLAGDAE